jgi:Spy/CpxP family protein refolding chaperone
MTRNLTTLIAAAILGGLVSTTTVFAEENTPSSQPPRSAEGTADDHGGIMNMMGQMNPGHMKQMTRMVDNCNRMMEGNTPTGPDRDRTPDHHG